MNKRTHRLTDRLTNRLERISANIQAELFVAHLRLWLAQVLMAPLPIYFGSRLRALILSWVGFDIGRGSVFWGGPTISGPGDIYKRLHIGRDCWFNTGCFLDLGASIFIGDRVSVGHQVMFLTSTHQISGSDRRAGPLIAQPIRVGNGVWLGARCTILPGVTIEDGAVVAAGAVITKDVPPDVIVAGVPATILRHIEDRTDYSQAILFSQPESVKSL